MPRSKNQKHRDWNIDDPHGFLAVGSEPRRMVDIYKASEGITQPQAVAELIKAGYAQLVSLPLPAKLDGPNPHGATDGSNTLEDR